MHVIDRTREIVGNAPGGSGGSSARYLKVDYFDDLPLASEQPDEIYVVRNPSGLWPFNRHPAGMYHSDGVSWTHMSAYPYMLSDANFGIQNAADGTKVIAFSAAAIATGTTRTISVPNHDVSFSALTTDYNDTDGFGATHVQVALTNLEQRRRYVSAGTVVLPTVTDNGNGSITIGNGGVYRIYPNADASGGVREFNVAGGTFWPVDQKKNFIYIYWNGGTPIMGCTDNLAIDGPKDYLIPYTIFRTGTALHIIPWGLEGLALAEKLNEKEITLRKFQKDTGLTLSEIATRIISIGAGNVYAGINYLSLLASRSDVDTCDLYYRSAGVWTSTLVTQYNNSQYDNGTNLVALTANRYAVNWIYRGVETEKHMFILLGNGDYTLTQAQASLPDGIPDVIAAHAMLVGRIIVQAAASVATQIDQVSTVYLASSSATSHTDLLNRDVAGNHAKLIPASDSTTAIQITKANGTTALLNVDSINNRIGILTTNPLGSFDISSGSITAVMGANTNTTTRTDATNKIVRIGLPHYTNAEEPLALLVATTELSNNTIYLGGGTDALNAATLLVFYTASNTTTITGTERMRINAAGNVGIGTNSPNANAILDIVSTTKAFMPPRMTTAQRDAIPSPTASMLIYNTTTNLYNFYNGSVWGAI